MIAKLRGFELSIGTFWEWSGLENHQWLWQIKSNTDNRVNKVSGRNQEKGHTATWNYSNAFASNQRISLMTNWDDRKEPSNSSQHKFICRELRRKVKDERRVWVEWENWAQQAIHNILNRSRISSQ